MELTGRNWSEAVMDLAQLCVAPIWPCSGVNERPSSVKTNGTGTFVDTGRRKTLVTNHHVLREVRRMQATHPGGGLAVNLASGVSRLLSSFEVIAEEEELDLAVIDFPHLENWPGHPKRYFPVASWPVPSPKQGDPVTIVGFPGHRRVGYDEAGLFEPVGIGMRVTNNPSRHVILADECGTLKTSGKGIVRPGGIEPGGMSGSAGFFFFEGRFHLAGFVYEGRADVLFLAPASRLTETGTIAPF